MEGQNEEWCRSSLTTYDDREDQGEIQHLILDLSKRNQGDRLSTPLASGVTQENANKTNPSVSQMSSLPALQVDRISTIPTSHSMYWFAEICINFNFTGERLRRHGSFL